MSDQEYDSLAEAPQALRDYWERRNMSREERLAEMKYFPGSVAQTRQATRDAVRRVEREREQKAALSEIEGYLDRHPNLRNTSDPTFQAIAREFNRLLDQGHPSDQITEAKAARNVLAKRGT